MTTCKGAVTSLAAAAVQASGGSRSGDEALPRKRGAAATVP